jgi:hypothetical protein
MGRSILPTTSLLVCTALVHCCSAVAQPAERTCPPSWEWPVCILPIHADIRDRLRYQECERARREYENCPYRDANPQPAYTSTRAGNHTHEGFYMRLAGGGGFARAADNDIGAKRSGASLAMAAAFGYAFTPNLIVYAEVAGHRIPNCAHKDNVESGVSSRVGCDIFGIGPGMAYYFMPSTVYISGTVIVLPLVQEDSSTDPLTSSGFGFNLMVGKEWWLFPHWGLGIAAEYLFAWAKDNSVPGSDSRWTSHAVGAMVMVSH